MSTPVEETLDVLNDLVHMGKVRYLGAPNYAPSHLVKTLMTSRMNGWSRFVSLQAENSLIVRSTEWELLPLCREEGLGFLSWSPLAGGWLTGKYRRNMAPPPDSRVGRKDRWDDQPEQRKNELTQKVIDALLKISENRGKTHVQIALNWLINQSEVTAPILGARAMEQLKENIVCIGQKLSKDEMEILNNASEIPIPYPYRFIEMYTRKRLDNQMPFIGS